MNGKLWALRLPLFLALCLFALTVQQPAAGEGGTAEELSRLRQRIGRLQSQIEQTRGQRDELRGELRDVERRIGTVARKLRLSRQQLSRNRAEFDSLTDKRARLDDKLAIQRVALAHQVRAAYAIGQQQYLKLLLNQEDPGRVGRVLTYHKYLNRARTRRIDEMSVTLAQLAALEDRIQRRSRELERLQAGQLQHKAELESFRSRRARVVARLSRQVSGQSQEIARLRRDETRLQRLLKGLRLYMEELREDGRLGARFGKLRGLLRLPVRARVQAYFGDPKQGGPLKWDGIFLDADEGQQVHAVFRGRVAFADWFGGLGLLLILDHGDGYMSLYGHNQALYVEIGDWVETGQVIAAVGNSGGLAEAGLYFEIRHNSLPRDPLKWCRAS